MLVTKNERTGGLDSSITVDNALILKAAEGVFNLSKDAAKWIGDVLTPEEQMKIIILAGFMMKRPINMPYGVGDVLYNIAPDTFYHQQYFYDDGINAGFGKDGMMYNDDTKGYVPMDERYYDDRLMMEVIKDTKPRNYDLKNNNCQDYCGKLRDNYNQRYGVIG